MVNEDLEKFKGKYFDSEQKRIELGDQLDEAKEGRYKMEEQIESLKAENVALQRKLDGVARSDALNANLEVIECIESVHSFSVHNPFGNHLESITFNVFLSRNPMRS